MDSVEPISRAVPAANTPADLARRHRSAWAEAACGALRTLDLGTEADPLSALEAALEPDADWQAISWLDAEPTEALLGHLRTASTSGLRIVLAVPAEARRLGPADARALAATLDGALLSQRLAGTSLIHAPDTPPTTIDATVEDSPVGDASDASAWLIAANVPADVLDEAGRSVATPAVSLVHGAYLERLEAANAGLRRANARLAREHLGRHDSAAASVIWKLEQVRDEAVERADALAAEIEQLKGRLEAEVEIARRNDEFFQDARNKLSTRPHRAVSGLERRFGRLPGFKKLFV